MQYVSSALSSAIFPPTLTGNEQGHHELSLHDYKKYLNTFQSSTDSARIRRNPGIPTDSAGISRNPQEFPGILEFRRIPLESTRICLYFSIKDII